MGTEYAKRSFEDQRKFAEELKLIGKKRFVQTPNKNFPIESHTWLPFIQYLLRGLQIKFIKWMNRWWIKKTTPDWYLLTKSQMQELFPDSTIVKERVGLLYKSLIAVKN